MGGGLVHNKRSIGGDAGREELPDTLLGPETTDPSLLGLRFRRAVVAPLWWWGVVFDLWIVVASI
ncbi:hypothetical protein GCM10010533_43310 [Mycolicibacterium pallens]